MHLAVIASSTVAIACGWLPWLLVPLLSLVIGVSFAGLTFVAHEGVHGAIVSGHRARQVIGWIGFLPFVLSPRLWAAWHDRVHHANANLADDPDVYPTLAQYRASRRIRFFVDAFALGGRRWRGVLSLVLGFTIKSAHQLMSARRSGLLRPRVLRLAIAETLAGLALWGPSPCSSVSLPFCSRLSSRYSLRT
jgi:fatty acid desaturase